MPIPFTPPPEPNALRRYRASLKKTQTDVATAIQVGLDRYCRLEHGTAHPTPREAAALAALFGVTVRRLHVRVRESARVRVRKLPRTKSA